MYLVFGASASREFAVAGVFHLMAVAVSQAAKWCALPPVAQNKLHAEKRIRRGLE